MRNQSSSDLTGLSDLSILCVTKGEDCVLKLLSMMVWNALSIDAEIVLACDGQVAYDRLDSHFTQCCGFKLEQVDSKGYIESVLDKALGFTARPYILRLDDDESISPVMLDWLIRGGYRSNTHWKFNRAHLWHDDQTMIMNPPLYPDHQTRLSVRDLSGGRSIVHCGSPFGGGELAPGHILHHKFMIKTREQRQEIVKRYNRIQRGTGDAFKVFSLPEECFPKDGFFLNSLPVVEAFSAIAPEFRMEQIPEEIWPFAEWLYTRKPHNVLEIGVRHGGTSALWHGLCTGLVVGVDWGGQDSLGERETIKLSQKMIQAYPRYRFVMGDSHLQSTINLADIGESFDFIFIDGDHSYEGVRSDFINYRPLLSRGSCIAFHDIVETPTTLGAGQGVGKFWKELKQGGHKELCNTRKCTEFSVGGEWGGIGVVELG